MKVLRVLAVLAASTAMAFASAAHASSESALDNSESVSAELPVDESAMDGTYEEAPSTDDGDGALDNPVQSSDSQAAPDNSAARGPGFSFMAGGRSANLAYNEVNQSGYNAAGATARDGASSAFDRNAAATGNRTSAPAKYGR